MSDARRPSWYATDNGFPSEEVMDAAHAPIVSAALAALAPTGGSVLDLGCGNGALLAKIHAANPRIQPFGVEAFEEKVAHGRFVLGELAAGLHVGDLFDVEELWTRRYALTLLMPGRLLEVSTSRAERLRSRLASSSERLLVYAYGDWLSRFGGLAPLARSAGLTLTSEVPPDAWVASAVLPSAGR